MSGSFQLIALASELFSPLFTQSDEELKIIGARRVVVDEKPGFPCRVSLADAEIGETVLLVPFTHHDASSPYRASGPIYIRSGVTTATPAVGEVPVMFRHRQLSIRAYDDAAMMVDAVVVKGTELESTIQNLFSNQSVSYLHIHNAGPGCYNCRVLRA
jgi:hypothetical protein